MQFAPGRPDRADHRPAPGHRRFGHRPRIGGGGGDFQGVSDPGSAGGGEITSRYRGAQGLDPEFIKSLEVQFGFDKPSVRALRPDAVELHPLRFRRELLPRHQRHRPDHREDAGVDLARPVDDAALLSHLDPARHPEGDAGRLVLRHLDQRRDHRRLRHPRLPLRHPAHHPLRRRQLLRLVPAPRTVVGPVCDDAVLAVDHRSAGDRRLFLASGAAAHRDGAVGFRHDDAPHQELVSRRDPEAIRDDGAGQGPAASARCSTATSSGTRC